MKAHLPQLNKVISLQPGESLYQTLKNNNIPIASSCKGEGICGKCTVDVNTTATLPKESPQESELKEKLSINADKRLSCQLVLTEDSTVTTTYW